MSTAQPLTPTPTPAPGDAGNSRRLGMFGGVFTPSILTILGLVMYLRFGWVVGSVGLGGALIVVLVSHLISAATGLSVSAIATNKTVGAGGAYYMISRSLGGPVGAAVGVPLFFAQALSVTFYIVGFTESLSYLVPSLDPRIWGTVTLVILAGIALRSAELVIKVQYVVMAAILLSIVSFFGAGLGDMVGIHGLSSAELSRPSHIEWFHSGKAGYAEVFAVFFPAVTGIMAGVSMSGDLKDPRRALPRGTMLAILAGFIIYMTLPFWFALNASNETLADPANNRIMWGISVVPAFIYLGVWGATLSSAVGSILAAPRTLQALAVDKLAPKIFARGHGPAAEPRNGLIFTFFLAEIGVLLGSVDIIAPVLTMFFLATYGVTNLASGLERWAASPSFRPTFSVPAWVSLGGAAACFYAMSVVNALAMVVAALLCGVIYLIAERRALSTTYGDARHGIWSALVRTALRRLHRSEFHAMNWRPNMLVFGGPPDRRAHLLELGATLVQDRGIVTFVQMMRGKVSALAPSAREARIVLDRRLREAFPYVFCRVDIVPDMYPGIVTVTQSYGIGNLEANTIMLGWLRKRERAQTYFATLKDLSYLHRSLLLVHLDPERGFGQHKSIHVWWGGLQGNGPMMLLLTYLITSDTRWRGCKVTALTVVDNEQDQAQATERLVRLLESARLDATPRVLLRKNRSITEVMAAESQHADLALVGLRLPATAQDAEPLFDHYSKLVDQLPSCLLVHSGHAFDGSPVLFDDDCELES